MMGQHFLFSRMRVGIVVFLIDSNILLFSFIGKVVVQGFTRVDSILIYIDLNII